MYPEYPIFNELGRCFAATRNPLNSLTVFILYLRNSYGT